jgi:hypothetical protein
MEILATVICQEKVSSYKVVMFLVERNLVP